MTTIVNGTTGITFSDNSIQNTAGINFRNRIINGDMRIDQRNAGASVTPTNSQYLVDRFYAGLTQASKFTVQRNAGSVTPPAGFSNYLGVTSSSAYSVLTGDTFYVGQAIEGFNVADFGWGAAGAATVTLSFWVRSSLTGTFGGSLSNATGRSYPFSYTISAANTWEQKSVTVAGDTTGTWLTTNGVGVVVWFGLGSGSTYTGTAGAWSSSLLVQPTGSTSVVGTNGATFYITGVQLEKATTASSFDFRSIGTELMLCQRYARWQAFNMNFNPGAAAGSLEVPVSWHEMRASPTAAALTADPNTTAATTNNATNLFQRLTPYGGSATLTSSAGGTAYVVGYRSLLTAEL